MYELPTPTILPQGPAPSKSSRKSILVILIVVGLGLMAGIALFVTRGLTAPGQASAALSRYLDSVRAGDVRAAQRALCPSMRAQLSSDVLERQVAQAARDNGRLLSFEIGHATIQGSVTFGAGSGARATATVDYVLQFERRTEQHRALMTHSVSGWAPCGFQ